MATHYTPKQGSWLNIAEIELSIRSRQCLDRRIADQGGLVAAVTAWEDTRTHLSPLAQVRWLPSATELQHVLSRSTKKGWLFLGELPLLFDA